MKNDASFLVWIGLIASCIICTIAILENVSQTTSNKVDSPTVNTSYVNTNVSKPNFEPPCKKKVVETRQIITNEFENKQVQSTNQTYIITPVVDTKSYVTQPSSMKSTVTLNDVYDQLYKPSSIRTFTIYSTVINDNTGISRITTW